MADRASTAKAADKIIADWTAGEDRQHDRLQDALGWTYDELTRYQATGEVPKGADE